jgi:hypothetical protein
MGQSIYSQNRDIKNYPNCQVPIENSCPLKCKVFRIKKTDKAYIIDIGETPPYAKYTIISLKIDEKQDLNKIKKGKQYEFKLFAYFDFILISDPAYRYGTIYTIEGIPITFKEDFKTGEVVTTPNLQGLYYVEHP